MRPAVVMGMSSLQIILEAVRRLVDIATKGPSLELSQATIAILVPLEPTVLLLVVHLLLLVACVELLGVVVQLLTLGVLLLPLALRVDVIVEERPVHARGIEGTRCER